MSTTPSAQQLSWFATTRTYKRIASLIISIVLDIILVLACGAMCSFRSSRFVVLGVVAGLDDVTAGFTTIVALVVVVAILAGISLIPVGTRFIPHFLDR